MHTQELRRKARKLYNNSMVSESINQHNQRKWVRAMLNLGENWLLAKQVKRVS